MTAMDIALGDPWVLFAVCAALAVACATFREAWLKPRREQRAASRERAEVIAIGSELAERRRAGQAARFAARKGRIQ